MCACDVCVCGVRVHVCMCVCVCVCSRRDWSRVFAGRALAVVQMAVYLTGYCDYLTSFREPLLPRCGCESGLKNVMRHHCNYNTTKAQLSDLSLRLSLDVRIQNVTGHCKVSKHGA